MPFEELEFHAIGYVGMIGDDLHMRCSPFTVLLSYFEKEWLVEMAS